MMAKLTLVALALPCLAFAGQPVSLSDTGDIKFTAQNQYLYLTSNEYDAGNYLDQTVWSSAFQVDYNSYYYNDNWGANVSLFGVVGHDYKPGFFTRHILKSGTDSDGNTIAENVAKFAEYSLKQQFQWNDTTYRFYEGNKPVQNFGILDSRGASITLSTYNGIFSEIESPHWIIKSAIINKYEENEDESPVNIETSDGDKIDLLYTIDTTYTKENHQIRYYYGESKDYLLRHYGSYSYIFSSSKVTAGLLYEHGLKKYKGLSSSNRLHDDDAWQSTLSWDIHLPKTYISLGYAYTSAQRDDGLGKLDFEVGSVHGNGNIITHGDSRYLTNDGEHVGSLLIFHDFTDEYTMGFDFRYGFGIKYAGNDLNEYEVTWVHSYKPQAIPNLELSLVGALDRGFQRGFDNTPDLDSHGHTSRGKGGTLITAIKYSF